MNPTDWKGATFHYSAEGTNTLTQVQPSPTTLYSIHVTNTGAALGYLQVYNNGSADAGAGTPDLVFPVEATSSRNISLGAVSGVKMSGGLSYLWGTATTGTAVHVVNAIVSMIYKGTAT